MATINEIKKRLESKGWRFSTSMQKNNNGKHVRIAKKGLKTVFADSWTALFKKI